MTTVAHVPTRSVHLGLTHLEVNDKLVKLLKCPLCNFMNIHDDEIQHHIQWTNDTKHNIDLKSLDNRSCLITSSKDSQYGPYVGKENLNLPWIRCLFCDYQNKIEFDLSLHILEEHRRKLLQSTFDAQDRRRTVRGRKQRE